MSGETLLDEETATFTVSNADCSWLDESPKSGTVASGQFGLDNGDHRYHWSCRGQLQR